ncbi:MAG: extracellular solute-binding protein [Thermoflexales bacterium]|nr:extracellular solute-binding protein [Thermoflexales bacterium]
MDALTLTIMARGVDPVGDLRPLLDQFEAEYHVPVHVDAFSWATGWASLVKLALYKTGADVSEVGTNWVGNLVTMMALHPFHKTELAALGAPSAFLPTAWQGGSVLGEKEVWAVPWLADTRLIYYRRDWLQQAGIDEASAFLTPAALKQTLGQLRASGVSATPWIVVTQSTSLTLHNVSGWVWAAGGDWISPDGKRILFDQPEARAGLKAYFDLHRYMLPAARSLNSVPSSDALFLQEKAAMTISGPWLMLLNMAPSPFPDLMARVGAALPPGGMPFVGGSHLVVWEHSPRQRLAVELVRFLTSRQAQAAYCPLGSLLPVRLDVLHESPYADHPVLKVLVEGVKAGRTFPNFPLWGLIEDGLVAMLNQIWQDVLAGDELDLDEIIARRVEPLARTLNMVLAQDRL